MTQLNTLSLLLITNLSRSIAFSVSIKTRKPIALHDLSLTNSSTKGRSHWVHLTLASMPKKG
ncbi:MULTISPECIES: hypothetical protein [unclassified Microcoleus]|uniref:hypothetical protein n=1 Tax=unclassified Microcoleus TaxID=2642155 RepID=UPI002FCF6011